MQSKNKLFSWILLLLLIGFIVLVILSATQLALYINDQESLITQKYLMVIPCFLLIGFLAILYLINKTKTFWLNLMIKMASNAKMTVIIGVAFMFLSGVIWISSDEIRRKQIRCQIRHFFAEGYCENGYYNVPPIEVTKPIIYLYPKTEQEVSVAVGHPEKLSHTYPKYIDGWHVKALPNGTLTDLKTNRQLYALYWEGKHTAPFDLSTGFIVKGADTISFLEDKLARLGLNEREAEEFIVYWLPQLQSNPYNYIYFATLAEQNQNMPLLITPQPDTLIRVLMVWKPLATKINIPEQVLPATPQRTGFTVIEWGGTEIDKGIIR